MKKKIVEKFEQYCSECGAPLIRVPVPAEKAKIALYGFGDISYYPIGDRFNKYTGKRQFGIRVMCPHAKWYNHCTNYIDEKSLHDCDIEELTNLS